MISEVLIKILFSIFSVYIAALDFATEEIPRIIFIIAFPFFFFLGLLQTNYIFDLTSIAGALLGLIVFLLAYILSKKRLGLADVWYSALIGLVFGFYWWYAVVFFACALGVIIILVTKKRRIPFIPCMALGSIGVSIIKGLRL